MNQWVGEFEDWQNRNTCDYPEPKKQECIDSKLAITTDINKLINSIEKNIAVFESYKSLPKDLNRLISIKEVWLEQILCNIDAIAEMTTGWITKNGKRFKAWVELFVLIKAILKSWQLLIDVFVDYSAECQTCKNSR